jgi:2-polyprenyl-3-methyl-5-hydroxy-6-metoxy-1,4-benzoquinol methylase
MTGTHLILIFLGAIALIVLVQFAVRRAITIRPGQARDWRDRVMLRYQKLPQVSQLATFAWVFAWFKLRLDPMFRELPEILASAPEFRTALDLGCGFGIPACALLELREGLAICGIDPRPTRVRVASAVFADRGQAIQARAPDFERPQLPEKFDAVFILDMLHYLSDPAMALTLQKVFARLNDGGLLIVRAVIGATSADEIQRALTLAGFEVQRSEISGGNPNLRWFIARARHNAAVPAGSAASQ